MDFSSVYQKENVEITKNDDNMDSEKSYLPPHIWRERMKERRRQEKRKYLAMKGPMYDNVRMLDPQGELLCTISKKKGDWYIEKGIAEWSGDKNKTTIQLLFEPKNRSNRGERGLYVRSDKLNQCVACGSAEYHMRHYVVPFAYRTLFPDRFKSHLSHDIVILCPECHVWCDQRRQKRMNAIEDELRGNAHNDGTRSLYIMDHKLHHLRSCALALLNWAEKLPDEKRLKYDEMVRDHLSLSDKTIPLAKDQLQEAIDVEYKVKNPNYVSGPQLVAEALGDDDEKITEFVRGWRRHFLETARPKHLPTGWSIDNSVVCGED